MQPEDSLLYLKELTTGPYPHPDQSLSHLISGRSILILSHLCLDLPSGLVSLYIIHNSPRWRKCTLYINSS